MFVKSAILVLLLSQLLAPSFIAAQTVSSSPSSADVLDDKYNATIKYESVTRESEQLEEDQTRTQTQKADDTTTVVVTAATQTEDSAEDTTKQIDTSTVAVAPEVAATVSRPDDGPSLMVVVQSESGSNEIRPSEEVIKETELSAVAAVDQSIGFGTELNLLFQNDKEPCYDEYGNPRFCEPEFENVAYERTVEVASECGQPASRFCTSSASGAGGEGQIRNCHICDAQHPKKRHPASYLTDSNSANNPTCWVSAPIQVDDNGYGYSTMTNNNSSSSSEQQATTIKGDNVTLTLNLDKTYEILYVSLQFCSPKPDSLSIEKSKDFGKSWQPYQFYSSHCARLYNRQQQQQQLSSLPLSSGNVRSTMHDMASCANVSSSGSSATRVAFSTLDSRAGASLDKSAALQDWVSATNIRITLDRHQAGWIQSTLGLHSSRSHSASELSPQKSSSATTMANQTTTAASDSIIMAPNGQQQQQQPESSQQLTNPSSDTYNYAISDLTIGGRCKCNGHASRCIHDKDGRLQCDCRHNTAGRDCEKCAPLHADRPWARATPTEANICQGEYHHHHHLDRCDS